MNETLDGYVKFMIKQEGLTLLRETLKQLEIKHRPFKRWYMCYTVEVYPSDNLTFFVLKMHDYIVK